MSINVLFIAEFKIDANLGGVQRITATLAKQLIKEGINVSYLAVEEGQEEWINGVCQYFVPQPKTLLSSVNVSYLKNLLKTLDINIIIYQSALTIGPFRLIQKSLTPSVRLISVHHNSIGSVLANYSGILRESFGNRSWFRLLDNSFGFWLARQYHLRKYGRDFQLVISKSDRFVLYFDEFISELNHYRITFPKKKVVAIPNPCPFDISPECLNQKENSLLFVGRLNYSQKRVDLLIDIWKKLFNVKSDWTLHVVGDGPVKAELIDRAQKEGLERIFFHGYKDPRPFFKKAKIFCMTSAFEGFGMVLVEAQAYGVVPFAFNCFSALPQVIQSGITGKIIEPFDVDHYSAELLALMNDDTKRLNMANSAFDSVKRFQLEDITKKWVGLFDHLLKDNA